MSRVPSKPARLVRYSIAAILVSLVGIVSICIWTVLMAYEWGSTSNPTVLYLPPWVLPIILMVLALVLLAFHWREIAAAEADRRLTNRGENSGFELTTPPEIAAGRFKLLRSGFSNALPMRHKVHTVASHVLALAMAVLLVCVSILLLRLWLRQSFHGF